MRTRLAAVLDGHGKRTSISSAADRKLGIATPWTSNVDWRHLLPTWDLVDLLSLVTIAFSAIQTANQHNQYSSEAQDFLTEVQEIFDEENVHYRVDTQGGVHFKYDRAFDEQVAATLSSLNGERYANARTEFERARVEMLKATPDGKQALRSVFTATEAIFKLVFPQERRLTANSAQKIAGLIDRAIGTDDPTARAVATKALDSFKDWIDAVHNYRHEQGAPDPVQPPLLLAQHLFSCGAAHVRWLADLDRVK